MSWTYKVARVVTKSGDYYYDMREYYPDVSGGPAWSAQSEAPLGEDVDALIWDLKRMLQAARKARRDPSRLMLLNEEE